MSKKTAIVSRDEVGQLRAFLESPTVLRELQKAMPCNLSPQRLVRQVLTLAQTTPELLLCTPMSILACCMKAAELGLELTGPLGHAHLVPRWDKQVGAKVATFQVGWKGLVLLAFRSGRVASMPIKTVYANDEFDIQYGTQPRLHHKPAPKDRGEATGYYAVVIYKGGGKDFEYMSKEEILAHKSKYSCDGPAWRTSFDAMAMKTVLRMLCRRLSLCPQAQAQAAEEEYEEAMMLMPDAPNRYAEVLDHLNQTLQCSVASEVSDEDRQNGTTEGAVEEQAGQT